MTTADQKLHENVLGVNPDDYRTCKRCKRLKTISEYRPIPGGRMSPVCSECQAEKARENKVLGSGDSGQRAWIIGELIKQYRSTDKNTDKIRCLEALAKLQPDDKKTPLDDPGVIQSLMKSLGEKKKREAKVKEDAGPTTIVETK
jgi:hypothetical protein